MKQHIDTEALMQQRKVAAEYFVDLTTELLHTLEHFCVKVNQLTQDGNQNPAVIVSLATSAALETDTTARFASTMVNILKGSLLPLTNRKVDSKLDSKITESRETVRSLIEAYSNIQDKKIATAAAKHQDVQLQESTNWLLVNAVKTFTAFNASLTNLQSALKDCTYALICQDDKTIKTLFEQACKHYTEDHKQDLDAFLEDVTSAVEATKDLKNDYRQNAAVGLYIKNPNDPVRVIKRLRDNHTTESEALDLLEFQMKFAALQRLAKEQKSLGRSAQTGNTTIHLQVETLNNSGVINNNTWEGLPQGATPPQIEE